MPLARSSTDSRLFVRRYRTFFPRAFSSGVGWHTLRKTFGSELARQGVSLLKIQKWLGHSDPRITMQHYAHLSPTFDEDINKIGKLKPAQLNGRAPLS